MQLAITILLALAFKTLNAISLSQGAISPGYSAHQMFCTELRTCAAAMTVKDGKEPSICLLVKVQADAVCVLLPIHTVKSASKPSLCPAAGASKSPNNKILQVTDTAYQRYAPALHAGPPIPPPVILSLAGGLQQK